MPARLAELELKIPAILGEGAIWNHRTQELYWVDIEGQKLHIYDPASGHNRTLALPSRIGTVVPTRDGQAVIGLEDGIYRLDPSDGAIELHAPVEADKPQNRTNDGKCDPAGRLWIGTMNLEEQTGAGALYRVAPSGKVETMLRNVTISNGIVWTADQRTMYYIDTPTNVVKAFDFDLPSGTISNERVAVTIDPEMGHPDGMTIDAEGMIWVALWGGSAVIRFHPRTGAMLEKVDVPALKVTSCAFGGPLLDTLYITTASIAMTPEQLEHYPDAGSLFSVQPGVSGVKSAFFG